MNTSNLATKMPSAASKYMLEVVERYRMLKLLKAYASLIEKVSLLQFFAGTRRKPLKDILTIEETPFWDIFSAELSWRHLTTAVNSKSIIQKTKLLIKPFYLDMRGIFFIFKIKN